MFPLFIIFALIEEDQAGGDGKWSGARDYVGPGRRLKGLVELRGIEPRTPRLPDTFTVYLQMMIESDRE